jgi:hypothetical protein
MYVTMYGGGVDKIGYVYSCVGVINCLSRIRQKENKMDGNSLRDEVKDVIRERVICLLGRQLSKEILFDYAVDIAGEAADSIFDLLHIDEDKQDMNYEEYMTG